jgi:hypothetical protein
MLQTILCGWYVYLAVLALLAAASAGRETWTGRVALAGAVCCGLVVLFLYWVPPWPAMQDHMDAITTALKVAVLAVGVIVIVGGRRQDTKLIGVLLAGTAALPLFLNFWQFPG